MSPIIMKFTLKSYCGKKNIVFKDNCRISIRSKIIFLLRLTLLGMLICGNKFLSFFFFQELESCLSQTLSPNPQFTPPKNKLRKQSYIQKSQKEIAWDTEQLQWSISVIMASLYIFDSCEIPPILTLLYFCSSFFS